jgi:hypothetical protein
VLAGAFEIHLTLLPDPRLADWAGGRGLKYTRIVLDRGATPDQPMLTLRGDGTLEELRAVARARTAALLDDGFQVVRVKIEAAPSNPGLPQDAAAVGPGCYFEHHVKLVLDTDAIPAARAISERHSAHLSRNARRNLAASLHERFVTQRCHDAGQPEAKRRLAALVAELTTAGLTIAEVEEEYVAVDSNPAVDDGWMAP